MTVILGNGRLPDGRMVDVTVVAGRIQSVGESGSATGAGANIVIEQRDGQGEPKLITLGKN